MVEKYPGATAVLYARVSTDDKDQDPETQVRQMKAWCEEHEVSIVGIYREEQSAKDLDRHEWDSLIGRIARGGVTFLLARDESRISRNFEDMQQVIKMLKPFGTVIRYVNSASTPEEGTGKIMNALNTWQAEEERKKLKANTKAGMLTKKIDGYHMGRPAVFMMAEDVPNAPKGRYKVDYTKVWDEPLLYSYARAGKSLHFVAGEIGISYCTLKAELLPREEKPRIRYNSEGEPVYFYRYKGSKDRYTEYMTLYTAAIEGRKGDTAERVGKTPQNCEERGENE